MTGEVIPMDAYRKEPARTCRCSEGFICYSHRLVDLAARIEDIHTDVEQFRFCDWGTFDRLTRDVLDVLGGIVADTLPETQPTEETR